MSKGKCGYTRHNRNWTPDPGDTEEYVYHQGYWWNKWDWEMHEKTDAALHVKQALNRHYATNIVRGRR